MSNKTRLNKSIMDNIWLLYEKGVSKSDIVKLLNISIASVTRVVKAFTIASNGVLVNTDNEFKDCKHIAIYANTKFGLVENINNEPDKDTDDILLDILRSLDHISELIKQLL